MLKDIFARSINYTNGNYYWGEVSGYANQYVPVGTGIHVKPDGSFQMAENHVNGSFDGYVIANNSSDNSQGYVANYTNNKLYGPCMMFKYGDHIVHQYYNEDGKIDGWHLHAWKNGNYLIRRYDNGVCYNRGIYFYQGDLYFVTINSQGNVDKYLSKIHVGTQLEYVSYLTPMMAFNKSKKTQTDPASYNYDWVKAVQVIGDEPNGYGMCRWDNGEKYFGEFFAGYRTGWGCYTYPDNNIYVGEFYHGEINGVATVWLSDGGCIFGKFQNGERHGISFDIFANDYSFEIASYVQGKRNSTAYLIDYNTFNITMVDVNNNNLGTKYFG